jgi:transposase
VAERLGVSLSTVDRLRSEYPDILPTYRLGRHIWLHAPDLDQLVDELRREQTL